MDEIKQYRNVILINSLGGGGAERQVALIQNVPALDQIITIEPHDVYRVNPTKKISLFDAPASGLLSKGKQLGLALIKLKKLGVNKHTKVYCFLQLSYILGYFAKKLLGCKLYICIRTNPFGYYANAVSMKMPMFLYKHILQTADKVLTNSATTALEIKSKLGLQQVHAIANGYNFDAIKKASEENLDAFEIVFTNKIVCIHTGRLDYDKGQWHLLRIFAKVVKNNPDAYLMIMGEGPYRNKLTQLCLQLQLPFQAYQQGDAIDLQAKVIFMGFQQNPYKYFSRATLFLFTSMFEGLPNAPIEAMICNLPVVMSDCKTGPREILLPESDLLSTTDIPLQAEGGYLMPPFTGEINFTDNALTTVEQIWVNQIIDIIQSTSLLQKLKQGCQKAVAKYNAQVMLDLWEQSFDETL